MLSGVLQQYGFSEREAKVYLACLELGVAPASSIARRLDENRVTVYSVLKVLKNKGVVFETQKHKTTYYGVVEPEKLLSMEQQKYDMLQRALPELTALMNSQHLKPKIQFYEGLEWIRQQYLDLLSSTEDDIYSFFNLKYYRQDLLDLILNDFVPLRIEKNIFAYVIMPGDIEDQRYVAMDDKKFLKKTILIDDPIFNLECQLDIYADNKVSIVLSSKEELSWFIIQSGKFHNTLKSIFSLIWNTYSP